MAKRCQCAVAEAPWPPQRPPLQAMQRLAHVARCVVAPPAATPIEAAAAAAAAGSADSEQLGAIGEAYFARGSWDGASETPDAARSLADAYAEHGIVVAQNLFSESECDQMQEELLRFQAGEFGDRVPSIEPLEAPMAREELLGRYMYIFQPHGTSALVREWMVDRRLRDVLGSIIGAHIPGWDGAYKCMQSMFVLRKPGAPGSPWHQDEHPIPTRDRSLCGIWIALSDATVDNGALWVVRDSHKSGIIFDRKPHDLPTVDSMAQAVGFEKDLRRGDAVPVPMSKGDVLCFNGYLLHSSLPNWSEECRPALTMHFCSMNTLLTWGGERNYRGVVPVQGEDPFAAEGYTMPNVGAKLEELSKPDNRSIPRQLDSVPPTGLGGMEDEEAGARGGEAQASGGGYR